jgi:two-component system KDP operon response regulator KdpE
VLFVVRDPIQRGASQKLLVEHGYRVTTAQDVATGLLEARTRNPDAVVVTLGTSSPADAAAWVAELRTWSHAPIVIVSTPFQEEHRVAGIDSGADDFLCIPFSTGELLLRLRMCLRRVHTHRRHVDPSFRTGDLEVDLHARMVTRRGKRIHLTPLEYKILSVLVRHAGTVVTGKDLLREVWGAQYMTQDRYLRVYMVHLRRKLEPHPRTPQYILTEPGVGYRLGIKASQEEQTER